MNRDLRQRDIWWVDLEPTRGTETQKHRPCVILQNTPVNAGSTTVIVAPLLPGHKKWPFAVNLTPDNQNALDKERHINIKQLRAVDISRLTRRQGVLAARYQDEIKRALCLVFDI